MANTVKTYCDPVTEAVKSYNKIIKRHLKREDNEAWQRMAREFKGVI